MSYVDLTKTNQDSSESQNIAISCLTNARLTSQTFTNMMKNVVNICKTKKRDIEAVTYVKLRRLEECVAFLNAQKSKYPEHSSKNDFESCLTTLKGAIEHYHRNQYQDESFVWIGLEDFVNTMSETELEGEDLEEEKSPSHSD